MARFRIFFGQVSFSGNYSLAASTGSFALAGINANLVYAPILHYSMSASAGSFALAGANANLIYTPNYVYLRPGSDVALDGWTDQADGTTNIYQAIDEASVSDSDFVKSPPVEALGGGTFSIGDLVVDTGTFLFGTAAFQKFSQSFISTGTSISKMRLKIGISSSPTDGVRIGIFTADANHTPVAQIGAYSSVIPYTALGTTATVQEFVFATPIPVTDGVEYCFTIERTVASFGGNCYVVVTVYPDSYTAGQLHYWNGAWRADYATFADLTCEIDFAAEIITGILSGSTAYPGSTNLPMVGQTFLSIGEFINSITVGLVKFGTTNDAVRLKLFTSPSGVPDVLVQEADATIPASSMGETVAAYTFTFTVPAMVVEGGSYCFTLERTGALDASGGNVYGVSYSTSSPSFYSGGQYIYQNSSGVWQTGSVLTDLFSIIDQQEVEASTSLTVRLFDGSTEIAEWTHNDIAETFTDAVQTLTTPQYGAITDFANLFVELDDDNGSVYRFSLGDPPGGVDQPINVRYRYKKLVA